MSVCVCGPESSVCIATAHGLEGPGLETDRDDNFRPI